MEKKIYSGHCTGFYERSAFYRFLQSLNDCQPLAMIEAGDRNKDTFFRSWRIGEALLTYEDWKTDSGRRVEVQVIGKEESLRSLESKIRAAENDYQIPYQQAGTSS